MLALVFPRATAQEKRKGREAQADTAPPMSLAELVALAEKDVAIKRAEVKVADAKKIIAQAKLRILKSKTAAAQASEAYAKLKLDRFKKLLDTRAISQEVIDEAEANYRAASARRQESENSIALGEAEVLLETARREVALAELDKTELRLQQLRDRLKSKK
jgi:multidrug resistance efflux pump